MNGETMQTSLRLHPYIIKQRYSDIIQPIFRNLVSKFFDVRSCEALACVCFDRASMSEQSSRMMVSSWKSAERMLQTCSYFEYIDRLCVKDVLDFIEIMLMDIQEKCDQLEEELRRDQSAPNAFHVRNALLLLERARSDSRSAHRDDDDARKYARDLVTLSEVLQIWLVNFAPIPVLEQVVPHISSRASTHHGQGCSNGSHHEAQTTRTPGGVTSDCRVREVEELVVEALRTWNELDAGSKWDALARIIETFKEQMPPVYLAAMADDLWQNAYPEIDNHLDSDWSIHS